MCTAPTPSGRRRLGVSASGSAREAEEAEGELDLQRAFRGVPLLAQQAGDALQALADGVHVDVQELGRLRQAAAGPEVRLQGLDERGAAPLVVVQDGADGAG